MVIGAPSDENECRQMLYTAFLHEGPAAVRYPRGTGPGAAIASDMTICEIGKAVEVRRGVAVAILNFGTLLPAALATAEKLDATVVDMRWVKPLDEEKILDLAQSHQLLVTLEENAVAGGAGAGVTEFLLAQGLPLATLSTWESPTNSWSTALTRNNCGGPGWTARASKGVSDRSWRRTPPQQCPPWMSERLLNSLADPSGKAYPGRNR
jgi:deoxyxylulose-5-phosphate synthase